LISTASVACSAAALQRKKENLLYPNEFIERTREKRSNEFRSK
jgi:hypothetical protein